MAQDNIDAVEMHNPFEKPGSSNGELTDYKDAQWFPRSSNVQWDEADSSLSLNTYLARTHLCTLTNTYIPYLHTLGSFLTGAAIVVFSSIDVR